MFKKKKSRMLLLVGPYPVSDHWAPGGAKQGSFREVALPLVGTERGGCRRWGLGHNPEAAYLNEILHVGLIEICLILLKMGCRRHKG